MSNRAIARNCGISHSTVSEYLQRAQAAGLRWPLPANLDEETLYRRLFPTPAATTPKVIPLPDWAEIHTELRRKGGGSAPAVGRVPQSAPRRLRLKPALRTLPPLGQAAADFRQVHKGGERRRLKAAQLPFPATIEALDLSPARGLDRRLVLQPAQGDEWLHRHLNAIVPGPTGVGKTFLAVALAHAACRTDCTARYHRTARLLHETALAHADGSCPRLLDALARIQLLVLDDWLRDPLTRPQVQTCSTSWTIATTAPPPWSSPRFPWPSGMAGFPTPPWPTPSWTAWLTTPTGSNCKEAHVGSSIRT